MSTPSASRALRNERRATLLAYAQEVGLDPDNIEQFLDNHPPSLYVDSAENELTGLAHELSQRYASLRDLDGKTTVAGHTALRAQMNAVEHQITRVNTALAYLRGMK